MSTCDTNRYYQSTIARDHRTFRFVVRHMSTDWYRASHNSNLMLVGWLHIFPRLQRHFTVTLEIEDSYHILDCQVASQYKRFKNLIPACSCESRHCTSPYHTTLLA